MSDCIALLLTLDPKPPAQTPIPTPVSTTTSAFKTANPSPFLSQQPSTEVYPISTNVTAQQSGPSQWPQSQQGRPTLTGGLPSGRVSGTPVQVAKSQDDSVPLEDTRVRKKNSPGDQSMRRTIQDLVSSIDPNVKIEPEVEDVSIRASPYVSHLAEYS